MNNNKSSVGARIRQEREKLGLSQLELALKCGFKSKSAVSLIESGKRDVSSKKLETFAKALNVSTQYLLGKSNLDLTNEEESMIEMFRKLTQKQKKKVLFEIEYGLDEEEWTMGEV